MAKRINHGKTEQILEFIREFYTTHGFGPTIREIGRGVGLQSTSTVAGHLSRMARDGLITSIPGTPRSIQTTESKILFTDSEDSASVLPCKFHFPDGTYPMNVVAMVVDSDEKNILPIHADCVEGVRPGRIAKAR